MKLAAPASGVAPSASAAGLLDWVLGCASQPCEKSGYRFSITNPQGSPVNAYTLIATPVNQGQTGVRGFCSYQVPIMMYDQSGGSACTQILQ
jgi:hypothetical protein